MNELYDKSLITIKQNSASVIGFFVSANKIITCEHGINWEKANTVKLMDWNGEPITTDLTILAKDAEEHFDFVVLECKNYLSEHAVHLNPHVSSDHRLTGKGKTAGFKFTDIANLSAVNWVERVRECPILKFVDGYIEEGYSGSPLLNLHTGSVCGYITDRKGLESTELGGYATGINSIYLSLPNLKAENAAFHLANPQWFQSNFKRTEGIGLHDDTFTNPHHFNLLNSSNVKIKIDDIYISPELNSGTDNRIVPDFSRGNLYETFEHVLSEQNVLFIFGHYGVGKTLLSKQIQKEFLAAGEDCLFVRAGDLYEKTDSEIWKSLQERKLGDYLYLIIDTFDELYDLDDPEVLNPILAALLNASIKDRSLRIIINSRNIKISLSETLARIDTFYRSKGIDGGVKNIIDLNYFSKSKITEWLSKYSSLFSKNSEFSGLLEKSDQDDEFFPDLFRDGLRKIHKDLLNSCKNPLLLFLLAESFKNNEFRELHDLYSVLGNFVKRTINGKFDFGDTIGSRGTTVIPLYQNLLKKIARAISEKDTAPTAQNNTYDFVFDNNTNLYDIENLRVEKLISLEKDKILAELGHINSINDKSLISKTFNDYFFEFNSDRWRYRDNNIYFYLLAEDYFTEIFQAAANFNRGVSTKETYDQLSEKLTLNPRIEFIELLVFKCKTLKEDERKQILRLIRAYFDNGFVLNLTEEYLKEISLSRLKLDLVLVIIYMQLNQSGYGDIKYFFSRLGWLIKGIKTLNEDLAFLTKRFFKQTLISGAEIKRNNFSGYNFDFSELKELKFLQNTFIDTRFNEVSLEKVNFELCELRGTEFKEISGGIEFKDCYLQNVIFTPGKGKECKIKFLRCFLKNITIKGVESGAATGRQMGMEIENSNMDTMHFQKIKLNPFNLRNCHYENMNFVDVTSDGKYISESRDKFYAKTDRNSKIRFQ